MSNTIDQPSTIHGTGEIRLPDGMTEEQARILAEQADNERNQ